jgi:hypothetical protein
MEICAIESCALESTEGVSPTVENTVVTETVPLRVVFNFGVTFPESPVAESHATCAAKRVVVIEVLWPLIVIATSEDWQVRVKEVIRYVGERLTIYRRREQERSH